MSNSEHKSKRPHYSFSNNNTNTCIYQDTPVKKEEYTFFYQIGDCKNPITNGYPMKKYILDSSNKFVDVRTYNLTSKQNKRFYEIYKPHQYKRYSVNDLSMIDPPSFFDINTATSSILSSNHNYSGNYAPF